MSVTAQNRIMAAFVLALITIAVAATWVNRGPLIDRSERPMPTFTDQTVAPAVEYQEEAP